jgi:hypothetical protein
VDVQAQANVAITGLAISGSNGAGPYVAGMSFTLTVTFSNTGGTQATNVDNALTFGTYAHLTPTDPDIVIIAAGGTNTQTFTITSDASATTAAVTIRATWIGTEAISSRSIYGGPNEVNVNMQTVSNVFVDTIALNATFALIDRWVLATVTVRNTGGTAVINGSIVLTFNATVGVTQVAVNQSTGLTLGAGATIGVQIRFQIPAGVPAVNVIRFHVTFNGTEAISNETVPDTSIDITIIVLPASAGGPDNTIIIIVVITGFGMFFLGSAAFAHNKRRGTSIKIPRRKGKKGTSSYEVAS